MRGKRIQTEMQEDDKAARVVVYDYENATATHGGSADDPLSQLQSVADKFAARPGVTATVRPLGPDDFAVDFALARTETAGRRRRRLSAGARRRQQRAQLGADAASTWAKVKSEWDQQWVDLQAKGEERYGDAARASIEQFRPEVTHVIQTLTKVELSLARQRANIDLIAKMNPRGKDLENFQQLQRNYAALQERYNAMGAGVFTGARVVEQSDLPDGVDPVPEVVRLHGRVVPVLGVLGVDDLVVLGIMVTIVAVVFCVAVAAVGYELELADEVDYNEQVLKLQRLSMETGQPIPGDPRPKKQPLVDLSGTGSGAALGIGLMIALAAGAVFALSRS